MGGYGSGRWRCHQKAITVEACETICLRRLRLEGHLEKVACSGFAILEIASNADRQVVQLRAWHPRFGGIAWRLICPGCHQTCMKLHRPSASTFRAFLCRRCWGLSYRSSQSSHRLDRGAVRAMLATVCVEMGIPFEVGLDHLLGRWPASPLDVSPVGFSRPSSRRRARPDPAVGPSGSSSG